ncbi:hypothetical protein ACTA71_003098 [Dictyostelium dimigraforme]
MSTLSTANLASNCDGYLVNTQGSNVFITNNTIGFVMGTPAITCSHSFVNFTNTILINKISSVSISCSNCNIPGYCGTVDDSTGTTSFPTSTQSSTTTTGGSITGGSTTGGQTSGPQPFTVSTGGITRLLDTVSLLFLDLNFYG